MSAIDKQSLNIAVKLFSVAYDLISAETGIC
jgi:hypothetical protein